MKKITLETQFTVFESKDELDPQVAKLMEQAIEARKGSYSPYSNFAVGAAILLANGEVVLGANQENASYPSGLCAERTALYAAGANHPDTRIKIIAISAGSMEKETKSPIPPCGACRQAIAEYETKQNEPIAIYFMGEVGKVIKSDSLADLLPLIFDKSEL